MKGGGRNKVEGGRMKCRWRKDVKGRWRKDERLRENKR